MATTRRKRKLTVGDLVNQIGMPYPRPVMACRWCDATFSANRGDYWNLPEDHAFYHCGSSMYLAVVRTVREEVRP